MKQDEEGNGHKAEGRISFPSSPRTTLDERTASEGVIILVGIERFPLPARATAVGRGLVALVFIIITATNVVAALVVHPWGPLDLLGQALELEGLAWSRNSAVITGTLLVLVAWALARGRRHKEGVGEAQP
jgi:hypothetical protein